ncbi:hypothetical protein GOBAR_AA08198 [Gossypium barbadense]|uniref:Uncharacterized protein n=1 Tax=Gossypium barbadense TaxID=3634 RepID=A0A2P5YA21_GOSBA|nr:hypothetical protein GOBAR_AA08198 [Gossypium barbadense]
MLTKFISILRTRFQNTETSLKNQQALIQGFETRIGQLTKLISEQPQGSLPSNTESNPRKQLNVITIQDEKGLVEPKPEPRQGIVELEEWRTHKPRTHDKPKSSHDELNISLNQLKFGDKELLDTVDPRIATSEPNGAIPLTVLSIFPYGMRSVNSSYHHDHAKERFSNPHDQAHRPYSHHGRRHDRAIQPCENREKLFPNTGYDKLPRPFDVAVGESVKATRACDTPVPTTRAQGFNITRACALNTGVGEVKEVGYGCATQLCEPLHPKNTGMGRISDVPKFKNRETLRRKLGHTGVPHGRVPQNLYKPLTIHHPLPQNP